MVWRIRVARSIVHGGGCNNASAAAERIVPHSEYLVIEDKDGEFVVTGYIKENFPADGKIEIPEGVNRIKEELFNYFIYDDDNHNSSNNNTNDISDLITSVTIAGSVKELPFNLFNYCTNLKEVILNEGIKIIGQTFGGCWALESIYMPDGLQIIAEAAFSSCNKLENISIPSSVDRIGYNAFFAISENIKSIEYRGTKDQWDKIIKSKDIFHLSPPVTVHCKDGDIENFTGGDKIIDVTYPDYLPRERPEYAW